MRPKSKVFEHFVEAKVNNKIIFTCKFCKKLYTFKNASKFVRHIVKKCDKCPEEIKDSLNLQSRTVSGEMVSLMQQSREEVEAIPSTSQTSTQDNNSEVNINQALARAIYVSGAPLALLEHPLWQEALHLLRPTYSPPSRKLLSTSLLEEEYGKVEKTINEAINLATVLHLAIDGWTNVRNESIVNVMIYAPKPYFYKFIACQDSRHTANYLMLKVSEILDQIGCEKFMSIVSDNASNMVKCGELIQTKYKHISWFGCLAHTLHLWVGDILKISKVRDMFSFVVKITKTIKKSTILTARFSKIAQERDLNITLHLPVKTRWGSYLYCLQAFMKSKSILQTLAIHEENIQLLEYKNKILEEHMWSVIKEIEILLKPIIDWITRLEGDYCSVHLVHKAFKNLEDHIRSPSVTLFLEGEIDTITAKFYGRKLNALKPLHLAAAILDPLNQGSLLSPDEHLIGCEFILNVEISTYSNAESILQEFSHYQNRLNNFQKDFVWNMAKTVAPILWWQTLYPKTTLGRIALKILSVPATSASVERSFSTFSNIHSNKRNRLNTDRAGKICYIAHNWKLMNRPRTIPQNIDISSTNNVIEASSTTGSEDDFLNLSHENILADELSQFAEAEYLEYDEILESADDEDPLNV